MIRTFLVLTLISWIAPAWAQPAELPDPRLTPGAVAEDGHTETSVCGLVDGLTYSKRHRATPQALKRELRDRDGAIGRGEIDHRVPLALGGADIVNNLWWQPGPDAPGVVWTYLDKDRLETEIWQRVCKRRTMPLEDGQAVFLVPDWGRQYCKVWPAECQ